MKGEKQRPQVCWDLGVWLLGRDLKEIESKGRGCRFYSLGPEGRPGRLDIQVKHCLPWCLSMIISVLHPGMAVRFSEVRLERNGLSMSYLARFTTCHFRVHKDCHRDGSTCVLQCANPSLGEHLGEMNRPSTFLWLTVVLGLCKRSISMKKYHHLCQPCIAGRW